MNRKKIIDSIGDYLAVLVSKTKLGGQLNLLDNNVHAENFYLHLLNRIFGWSLNNQNKVETNARAIDLVSVKDKLVIQVSATATKEKINKTLSKISNKYKGYRFIFVPIVSDAIGLKSLRYEPQEVVGFSPRKDILGVADLLKQIMDWEVGRLEELKAFLKSELDLEIDPTRVESNLAMVVKILGAKSLKVANEKNEIIPFKIREKITFNSLSDAKGMVDDFMIFHSRLNGIYAELDRQGANKSESVLESIRSEYRKAKSKLTADELFFYIAAKILGKAKDSPELTAIPDEELELCSNVIVVDAFVRCKIFENPSKGVKRASA